MNYEDYGGDSMRVNLGETKTCSLCRLIISEKQQYATKITEFDTLVMCKNCLNGFKKSFKENGPTIALEDTNGGALVF